MDLQEDRVEPRYLSTTPTAQPDVSQVDIYGQDYPARVVVSEVCVEEQTVHPEDPDRIVTGLFRTVDDGVVPNPDDKASAPGAGSSCPGEFAQRYDLSEVDDKVRKQLQVAVTRAAPDGEQAVVTLGQLKGFRVMEAVKDPAASQPPSRGQALDPEAHRRRAGGRRDAGRGGPHHR